MAIDKLDRYIQENKHLPDIPTTKDVEKQGINVGDIQTLLLKKVEELTLYMIQLKKENDELKKKVDEINTK
jgi:hypothetical protein